MLPFKKLTPKIPNITNNINIISNSCKLFLMEPIILLIAILILSILESNFKGRISRKVLNILKNLSFVKLKGKTSIIEIIATINSVQLKKKIVN